MQLLSKVEHFKIETPQTMERLRPDTWHLVSKPLKDSWGVCSLVLSESYIVVNQSDHPNGIEMVFEFLG